MPRPPALPYRILSARNRHEPSNVLISVPHAGRRYDWLEGFKKPSAPSSVQRRGEDPYVDHLALPLLRLGLPLIIQRAPRVLADVNRAPDDMDADLLASTASSHYQVRPIASEKARLGLGVVPTRLGSDDLYTDKLAEDELSRRLDRFHAPYHAALDGLAAKSRAVHSRVLILDLHSMPRLRPQPLPSTHFVLGNRFGRSCPDWLLVQAATALEQQGFSVACNLPYAGGYVCERHAAPSSGFYALQIEICRSLYLTKSAQRNLDDLRRPSSQVARKSPLLKNGSAQVVRALCKLAEVLQSGISQANTRSKAAE